jgi:hypothetical protein
MVISSSDVVRSAAAAAGIDVPAIAIIRALP